MKKHLSLLLASLVLPMIIALPSAALAQETPEVNTTNADSVISVPSGTLDLVTPEDLAEEERPSVRPIITTRSEVEVGKRLILDATRSTLPQGLTPSYVWDFGDGKQDTGEEVVHIYDKPGKYTATLTTKLGDQTYTTNTEIFAYKQIVTFFYNGDTAILENNLPPISELAEKYGTYLHLITSSATNPLQTEDAISEELIGQSDIIQKSAVIIGGPGGTSFLSALTKLTNGNMQTKTARNVLLQDKTIIVTAKDSLWLFRRIAQRMVGTLQPKELVLVNKDPFSTLTFLIQSEDPQQLIQKLPKDEYVQLTKETAQEWPVMVLSWLVTVGITNGIPSQIFVFILFMPFILTIIGFIKQCMGIETVGLFQTLVLTLSFYIIGATYGTVTMLLAVVVGLTVRYLLKKANILYLSKMSLLLSTSSLSILILLVAASIFGIYFGIDTSSNQRALLSIFPMVLIAVQADKLSLLVMNREHPRELIRLLATYGAVIVSYFLIKSETLELILLALPEIVIIPFILQYLIGRYTGLRLVEYVRFRELFRHDIEE